ncbi:MAG: LolA family protein [Nitrospiria bacterium]
MNKAQRMIQKLIFIFLLLLLPVQAFGESLPLAAFISKIQRAYEDLKDLRASFEQETVIQDFKTPVKYSGELFLKRRDKMKLAYLRPKKEELFINGKEMTTYLPDQHQAIKGIFSKEQESKLPVRLLSGEAVLDKEFKISRQEGKNSTAYHLLLIPRQKNENLEKIEVEIDPSTYLIKKLSLYQINQNSSSFSFTNVRLNQGLKDGFFIFTPPEGTEMIEALPPLNK